MRRHHGQNYTRAPNSRVRSGNQPYYDFSPNYNSSGYNVPYSYTYDNYPYLGNSSFAQNYYHEGNNSRRVGNGAYSQLLSQHGGVEFYEMPSHYMAIQPFDPRGLPNYTNADNVGSDVAASGESGQQNCKRKSKAFPDIQSSGKSKEKYSVSKKKDMKESQRETLISQLSSCQYECMVCCSRIRRDVAVWSCDACYNIFHLFCIKKWSQSLKTEEAQGLESELCSWRCPACQKEHTSFGFKYFCFCSKTRNPDFTPSVTPHSCGELCGRPRGSHCVHPCNLLCHPGPCPACTTSVQQKCFCGRTNQTLVCYKAASVTCDNICQRTLNCGKHKCKQTCHADLCSACDETIEQTCFCGKETRTIVCGTKESFYNSFSCEKVCNKSLECGIHECNSVCHAGPCSPCDLLPTVVTHCPCGKTSLQELTGKPCGGRMSCIDPVSTCDHVCRRELGCGPLNAPHHCLSLCHPGQCPQCDRTTQLVCRCGAQKKEVSCSESREVFLCSRRCKKKRQCGNHRCGEVCCIQDVHPCPIVCGRTLKCGVHQCERLCHLGHCPPCYHQSFDELTCFCGSSIIEPPVACGTRPPRCQKPCTRDHTCGHPPQHECHNEDQCPPCPILVSKPCNGGHTILNNIRCHVDNVPCGKPCNKPLLCGHNCQRICHRAECEDLADNSVCQQACSVARVDCDHPCGAPCHPGEPCPTTVCKKIIDVNCQCGLRHMQVQCFMLDGLLEQSSCVLTDNTVDLEKLSEMRKSRLIECDSQCAIMERNRKLAEALQLSNPDYSQNLGPTNYSRFLIDFASQYSLFAIGIENKLEDALKSVTELSQEVRHICLESMSREKRRFVHELAEYYSCQTWSSDTEPNRTVTITAKRGRSVRPTVKLSTVVQSERQQSRPMVLKPMKGPIPTALGQMPRTSGNTAGGNMMSLGKPLSRAIGRGSVGVKQPVSYADRAAKPDFRLLQGEPPAVGAAAGSMGLPQTGGNENFNDFDYFDMKPRTP